MEQPNHAQVPSSGESSAASSFTSFPYGLSGVAVSEPAYYADYGRKSRMCMYCGKVFTRSTTRRYHEVKCRSKQKTTEYSSNNQIPHSILNDVNFSPSSSHQSSVSPLDFVPPSSTPDLSRTLNTSLFDHRLPPTSRNVDMKGYNECRNVDMKSYDSDDGELLRKSPDMDNHRRENEKSSEREDMDNGTDDVINSPITSPVSPPQMEKETLESVLGIATSAVPLCVSRTSPLSTFPIVSMANMASMASLVNFHEQANLLRTSPPGLNLHVNPPYSPEMLLATSNVMAAMSFPWRPEDSLERRYNVASPPLEPFRCEICGKVLQSASQLTLHKRTHMKVRPYPCRICGSRFTTLSSRRSHERTHLGEKPYFCVVCGTRFTRKYSLKLHENKHVDGPYKCSHCYKMCDAVADLKEHLQCHNSPENKPSDDLLKSPPYLELNHHHHQQPNTSTPTSTSTTTTTTSTLQDDLNADKVGDSLLSPKPELKESDEDVSDSNDNSSSDDIMIDGKVLSDSGGGEDGEKTQRCEQCGEEFPHAYLLKIHVKVHASKPFECPVCGKKFGYRNNMKTHVKCHFGLKPHVCHICGSRFTRASTLRRHIEKHQAQGDTSNFCFGSSPVENSHASVSVSTSNIASVLTSSSLSPSSTHSKIPDGPLWLSTDRSSVAERGEGFQPLPAFSTFQNLATSSSYRMTPPSVVGMPQLAITPDSPPQTQALNLSVATPKREVPKHWAPESDISDMLGECEEGNNNNNISKSDHSDRETVGLQVKPMFEEFGVQVNTCGCHLAPLHISGAGVIKAEEERESEGFPSLCRIPKNTFNASPSLAQEEYTNMSSRMRTLLSLVQRGELFVCEFCECYFMEYAMLRIHKRMHAMGTHKPFVCAVCGEDCHDKVYFSLHMSEHLK